MSAWVGDADPGAETQMSNPSAVTARADHFQASAPHRTIVQWQALVESWENTMSNTLLWDDDEAQVDYAAVVLVRDRVAVRGAR